MSKTICNIPVNGIFYNFKKEPMTENLTARYKEEENEEKINEEVNNEINSIFGNHKRNKPKRIKEILYSDE